MLSIVCYEQRIKSYFLDEKQKMKFILLLMNVTNPDAYFELIFMVYQ